MSLGISGVPWGFKGYPEFSGGISEAFQWVSSWFLECFRRSKDTSRGCLEVSRAFEGFSGATKELAFQMDSGGTWYQVLVDRLRSGRTDT